jgi:hypothetical protein
MEEIIGTKARIVIAPGSVPVLEGEGGDSRRGTEFFFDQLDSPSGFAKRGGGRGVGGRAVAEFTN